MAYKCNNRMQRILFPPLIEDYVTAEDPVRLYDAFVDSLDFESLGLSLEPKGGADEYYPKEMLKLIIYGSSYGIHSSRKLERACHHNISFKWLMGNLTPQYRTIARFRSKHKEAIRKVLKQCVHICMKLDLIEGNTLFTDGSKFRANASISNTWTKESCEQYIRKIEKKIDQYIDESERIDAEEDQQESMIKIKQNIQDKQALMNKIKNTLAILKKDNKIQLNTTDPDCIKAKGPQGTHASYNVQSTVDEKHGLIVNAEAVSQSNDSNQLSRQVSQASEILGKKPENVCADSGYSSVKDFKKIDKDINIVVPSQKQAQKDNDRYPLKPFNKEQFKYNKNTDQYTCPEGNQLRYLGFTGGGLNKTCYRAKAKICRRCRYFGEEAGKCTKSKSGRKIIRLVDEELKEQTEASYASQQGQEIYKLRKQKVELPFGHLKRNLRVNQFMLRGKPKVNAEVAILATCFNITRMISILGIPKLILALKS
jgi:transposase